MAEARIAALLRETYGLAPRTIAPARRGFVAETFVARLDGGADVFVKWWPASADAARSAAVRDGLAVAERLAALGVTVAAPRRNRGGDLLSALDDRLIAVFPFIEGEPGRVLHQRMGAAAFNFDFQALVALVAEVHLSTPRLGVTVPPETFALPFAADFERAFAAASSSPTGDSHAELQTLIAPARGQIEADWADLRRMAEACRAARRPLVLTHGDLTGDNLIVGADGRLHAIDWDYPLLAPVERDAWFFTCDPKAEAAFLAAYRGARPDYRLDPLMRRFYLFSRFFEDILGYIDIVLGDAPPERKAWSVSELEKTCFEWLWPPMRALSPGP